MSAYPGTDRPSTWVKWNEQEAAKGNPASIDYINRREGFISLDRQSESQTAINRAIQEANAWLDEKCPVIEAPKNDHVPNIEPETQKTLVPDEPEYPEFDPNVDDGIPF